MRDLRQHRIFFGQLRVKYLIGRKAETAQKQFQRVHARSLFAQLDRGDLSVTNCTFFRKLLPEGKLCGRFLPVFTLPECKQVLILPKQYWTPGFTEAWVNGQI